jgi:hypothetical protein
MIDAYSVNAALPNLALPASGHHGQAAMDFMGGCPGGACGSRANTGLNYCCEVFHRASFVLPRCPAGQGMETMFGHARCSAASVLQVLVSSGYFSGADPSANLETAAQVQLSPHGEKRDEFASPIFVGSASPAGFLSSPSIDPQKEGNP